MVPAQIESRSSSGLLLSPSPGHRGVSGVNWAWSFWSWPFDHCSNRAWHWQNAHPTHWPLILPYHRSDHQLLIPPSYNLPLKPLANIATCPAAPDDSSNPATDWLWSLTWRPASLRGRAVSREIIRSADRATGQYGRIRGGHGGMGPAPPWEWGDRQGPGRINREWMTILIKWPTPCSAELLPRGAGRPPGATHTGPGGKLPPLSSAVDMAVRPTIPWLIRLNFSAGGVTFAS